MIRDQSKAVHRRLLAHAVEAGKLLQCIEREIALLSLGGGADVTGRLIGLKRVARKLAKRFEAMEECHHYSIRDEAVDNPVNS